MIFVYQNFLEESLLDLQIRRFVESTESLDLVKRGLRDSCFFSTLQSQYHDSQGATSMCFLLKVDHISFLYLHPLPTLPEVCFFDCKRVGVCILDPPKTY